MSQIKHFRVANFGSFDDVHRYTCVHTYLMSQTYLKEDSILRYYLLCLYMFVLKSIRYLINLIIVLYLYYEVLKFRSFDNCERLLTRPLVSYKWLLIH